MWSKLDVEEFTVGMEFIEEDGPMFAITSISVVINSIIIIVISFASCNVPLTSHEILERCLIERALFSSGGYDDRKRENETKLERVENER